MKKIALLLIILFLIPPAEAATKPARGFVKHSDGTPAENTAVTISAIIHHSLDPQYRCLCQTPPSYTSSEGEFVQDLGNLAYAEDCLFWSKSKGDPCNNDWAKTDKITAEVPSAQTAYETISQQPIHEFGTIILPSATQTTESPPAQPSTPQGPFIPIPETSPMTVAPQTGILITGIILDYSESTESFSIIAEINNQNSYGLNNLNLKLTIKDTSGQELLTLTSEKFSIAQSQKKQIKTPAPISGLAHGAILISAILYDAEKVIAASSTSQAFLFGQSQTHQTIIIQNIESKQATWPIWLFSILLGLILAILIFQTAITRKRLRQKKRK